MLDERGSGRPVVTPPDRGLSWSDNDQRIFVGHAAAWTQVVATFLDDLDAMVREVPELRGYFDDEAAVERHRLQAASHLHGMLEDPRDPVPRLRSHQVGMAHIAAGVRPSWYVMAYNRIFPAVHQLEGPDVALPPLALIRRRWLWDNCVTLDAYHEELDRRAGTDPLTGLANRRTIEGAVLAGGRGRCALALLDLDGFKSLNDRLGHGRGDEVLSQLGRALDRAVRRSDLVGRLGGDEFCIWMPDVSAATVTEWCRRVVGTLPLERLGIGISAGVALQPDDGEGFAELYEAADTALYRVKRAGKSGFALVASDVVPWGHPSS